VKNTRTRSLVIVSCFIGTLCLLAGCVPTPPVAEVSVTKGQTVKVGESKILTYDILNSLGQSITVSDGDVVWAVASGGAYVKFANGKAVGLKHGEATVVAIVNGVSSEPVKIVVNPVPRVVFIPTLPGANPADPRNTPAAISADGSVVVGTSDSALGLQAFRWTEAGGVTALGILPGYTTSDAAACNANGSVVVGSCSSIQTDRSVAFIWTAATGMKAIDTIPEDAIHAGAESVSADGKTVIGWYEIADNGSNSYGTFGFLWEAGQDLVTFSDFIPDDVSRKHSCVPNRISADGQVIAATVGYMPVDNPDPSQDDIIVSAGTRMTKVGSAWEPRILGWTPDGDRTNPNWRQRASTAMAINADGSVIWGTTEIPDIGFFNPYRWTPSAGMAMNMWNEVFVMQAVSHDGDLAVGGGADPGNAIMWDAVRGVRSMYGVMDELGILDQMGNYQPVTMTSVTADGQAMVGICGSPGSSSSPRAPVVFPPRAPNEEGMFRAFYVEVPRPNDQYTAGYPD
jgi:probable HAF family extracellular repeat protein